MGKVRGGELRCCGAAASGNRGIIAGMADICFERVTAAIETVVAATRKTKAALIMVPTRTIATGIAAVLVPIKGSRYIPTIYNHLQNAAEA